MLFTYRQSNITTTVLVYFWVRIIDNSPSKIYKCVSFCLHFFHYFVTTFLCIVSIVFFFNVNIVLLVQKASFDIYDFINQDSYDYKQLDIGFLFSTCEEYKCTKYPVKQSHFERKETGFEMSTKDCYQVVNDRTFVRFRCSAEKRLFGDVRWFGRTPQKNRTEHNRTFYVQQPEIQKNFMYFQRGKNLKN